MEAALYSPTGYQEDLVAGKLTGVRCANCQTVYLPPKPYCGHCGGAEMIRVTLAGGGVIETFSNVHFPTLDVQAAGFGREMPACAAIVRLDEGPAISAQVVGADHASTPEVRVGDRVRVDFVARGEGEERKVYPVFVPA